MIYKKLNYIKKLELISNENLLQI